MYDRIPSPGKENRVRIRQDNGQVVEGVLEYADDATQEGSTYTKGNVLPDRVLSLIGLPTDPSEPADMFNVLATVGDLYGWRRTTASGTDYPVSVNPNAYQEGSDGTEKPAGYTLGNVQTGAFVITDKGNQNNNAYWYYSDSVTVSDAGEVSLTSTASISISGGEDYQGWVYFKSKVAGKFVWYYIPKGGQGDLEQNKVYFFPSDITIQGNGSQVTVDKYQTVTGYPATPAGTTIEYLGKLGDKGVTGSYVGTGTKGSSNPNKIRFDRRPDVVFVQPSGKGNAVASFMCIVVAGLTNSTGNWNAVSFAKGGGSSGTANGYEIYASYDDSTNELSWFCASTRGEQWQQNSSGITYNYVAK